MSSDPIRIRAVRTRADADVCKTLQRVCLPWDDTHTPRRDGWWYVARTASGTAVAYSGSYLYSAPDDGKAVVIIHQGVIEAYRGLGLQRRLIRETCRQAKAKGVPEVWTYVAAANLASANSFIAEDFRLWAPAHWDGEVNPKDPKWLFFRKKVIE